MQEGICDKNTAPSVSSISRVLRTNPRGMNESDLSNEGNLKDHSIDGILGGKSTLISFNLIVSFNGEVNCGLLALLNGSWPTN